MNFLATHDCRPDFREFRNPTQPCDRRPRELFPALPRAHALQPTDAVGAAAEEYKKAVS